jgi:hypothetical protein
MSVLYIIPALIFLLLIPGLIIKFIDQNLLHPHGYDSSSQKALAELQEILDGTDGNNVRAFDNFISCPLKDPRLEAIRQHCKRLSKEFPPESDDELFGAKGADIIRVLENEAA